MQHVLPYVMLTLDYANRRREKIVSNHAHQPKISMAQDRACRHDRHASDWLTHWNPDSQYTNDYAQAATTFVLLCVEIVLLPKSMSNLLFNLFVSCRRTDVVCFIITTRSGCFTCDQDKNPSASQYSVQTPAVSEIYVGSLPANSASHLWKVLDFIL